NILSLGLFTFVINAVLLSLVSVIIPGFEVRGFGAAFLGALIITLVNWFLNLVMTPKTERPARGDVIDLKRKDGNRWE
ncbi:MAG: phage holin family protein, partial [Smithellaceae bacterium]|nr:phage holin family protein [Smithellaceae bacterium]